MTLTGVFSFPQIGEMMLHLFQHTNPVLYNPIPTPTTPIKIRWNKIVDV